MKFLQIILLLISGVCATVWADILLKKSGGSINPNLFWGIFIYAIVALPVAIAFKMTEFGIVVLLWEALIISISLLVSYFYFQESFTLFKTLAVVSALLTIIFSHADYN